MDDEEMKFTVSKAEIVEYVKVPENIFDLALKMNEDEVKSEYCIGLDGTVTFSPKAVDVMDAYFDEYEEKKFTFGDIAKGYDKSAEELVALLTGYAKAMGTEVSELITSYKKSGQGEKAFSIKGSDLGIVIDLINLAEEDKGEEKDMSEQTNTTNTQGAIDFGEADLPVEIKTDEPAPAKTEADQKTEEISKPEGCDPFFDAVNKSGAIKEQDKAVQADAEKTAKANAEAAKKAAESKPAKRGRKSRFALDKKIVAEDIDQNAVEIKPIRTFLIDSKVIKLEEIAVMSDKEIFDQFNKDYFAFNSEKGLVFINRAWLKANIADITDNVFVISDEV